MKFRIPIIISLLTTLILLCIHFAHHNPWLSLDACLKAPDFYDGQLVTSFREPLISEIYEDGFLLTQKAGQSIKVVTDTSGLILNKYIGLTATFHKEGYLKAVHLRVSENRRYKIVLSVLPALLVAGLFFRFFKWDNISKTWRPKPDA